MPSFDEAHVAVTALVKDFAEHESKYLAPSYQEAEVRKDFIDKFLIALGWDVNHDTQKNPYEQEVKVERSQTQGTARKRADYAFSLAPNFRDVRFFVEAKKPSVDIANTQDYFQALRYGWNSGNPLVVITDFEQFHILDSRYKPSVATALNRLIKDGAFHYRQYADPEKFSHIYWLLSREAVAAGSIEKYAATLPKPRGGAKQLGLFPDGTQKIDESFLEELDEYRLALARIFKKTDLSLDGETLTELVQRTLDRLVFIRFWEDRLIEQDYLVAKFGQKDSAWKDFIAACHRLDGIYNGVVFKKHALLDDAGFEPDDVTFCDICERLSHLNSPFDFNTIPIHILGSIYERFLGKVIIATAKQVRVEEKSEVRKAGGVYYTPDYIVRYIVASTVGKVIEGKNPDAISKMHFADVACGSGSFLLGVFDELLEYHTAYYNTFPKQSGKGDCFAHEDGSLHLTLKKRREILLNNIYGVDIDAQAVEVAQLSLYLRLLQDETTTSARQHQLEFHETLLPSLINNIKCGNSLVGMDILDGELFEPAEERKLNPMAFDAAFPKVMRMGGFDAIVGNPPYGAELTPEAIAYLHQKFTASSDRDVDTYALFMEQALRVTTPSALISMIVPTGWYSGVKYPSLRKLVACTSDPKVFVNLPYDVFADAWVDTTVFVLKKRSEPLPWPRTDNDLVNLKTFPKRYKICSIQEFDVGVQSANFSAWFRLGGTEYLTYANTQTTELLLKIGSTSKTLGEVADIQRGVTPFVLSDVPPAQSSTPAFGGTVRRYSLDLGDNKFIRYDQSLAEFKPARYFHGPRLLLRELISRQFRLQAAKVTKDFVTNKSMQSILGIKGGPSLSYLLGIINSRLMSWYFLNRSNIAQRDDFPKIVLKETRSLPVPDLNLSVRQERLRHDAMSGLVDQIITARQQLAKAKMDKDRRYFTDKCEYLEQEIDSSVYKLYGLTEDEVRLLESSLADQKEQPIAKEKSSREPDGSTETFPFVQ